MTENQNANSEIDLVKASDAETLKIALAEEKVKTDANLAGWQRAQADFVNYKRRSEQERTEITRFANSQFMLNLVPVLDDFERAFDSIPNNLANTVWVDGVRLIERKLRSALETQGLSPISAVGELFDPYQHEAIRQDRGKEGIVIEELQKGYKLHDRVIRPSQVVVGNGEATEEE